MKNVFDGREAFFFGIGIGISASLSFLFLYKLTVSFIVPIVSVTVLVIICFSLIYRFWISVSTKHHVHTLIVSSAVMFESLILVFILPFPSQPLPELRPFLLAYVAIFITTVIIILVSYVHVLIIRYAIIHKIVSHIRFAINDYYNSMNERM